MSRSWMLLLGPVLLSLGACASEPDPAGETKSPAGVAGASGKGGSSATAGQGGGATAGSGGAKAAGADGTPSAGAGGAKAGGAGTSGGSPSGGQAGQASGAGGGAQAGASAAGMGGAAGGAGGQAQVGPCEVPTQAGEFYALEAASIEQLDPIPMCTYRGKVVLVVNVASKCGYTPQYGPLEEIYEKYKDQGLTILGFPCNQFGSQEPGSDEDISSFCTMNYGITFPMFSKIEVNGANTHPIYQWLKSQPGGAGDIPWNFTKFLLGRDGKLVKRIPTATEPNSAEVIALIEGALAAAP